MRALITGGAGFIGSHLGEFLEKKSYEVIYLDNLRWSTRTPHNCVIDDVRNKTIVDFLVSQVDEVYHLAAQINIDYGNLYPEETVDINIIGTLNVLEACKKHDKRLIFASTSEVYGSAQTESINETHPLDAQSIYAASKVGADRLCKSYFDAYGLDVRILRNFNTFGTFQRFDSYGGVIAIFVDRALKGKPPLIYGDGTQERDYMWVDDAVVGYELIASSAKPGDIVNVGSGKTISINELANLIVKHTGCPEPIHIEKRPGEVMRLKADITKAKSMGFKSKTDFEKHLIEYINWRKNYESISGK